MDGWMSLKDYPTFTKRKKRKRDNSAQQVSGLCNLDLMTSHRCTCTGNKWGEECLGMNKCSVSFTHSALKAKSEATTPGGSAEKPFSQPKSLEGAQTLHGLQMSPLTFEDCAGCRWRQTKPKKTRTEALITDDVPPWTVDGAICSCVTHASAPSFLALLTSLSLSPDASHAPQSSVSRAGSSTSAHPRPVAPA